MGFARTGLGSLERALTHLGFRLARWPYRWDRLAETQGAVSSVLTSRYRELDRRFPGSKFVLAVRAEQSLVKSRLAQDFQSRRRAAERIACERPFDSETFLLGYRSLVGEVKAYFADRPEDLLLLDIVGGQGWTELASYLSLQIPKADFPFANGGGANDPGGPVEVIHQAAQDILRREPQPFTSLFESFVNKETYESMARGSSGHNDLRYLLYLNALVRAIKPRKVLVLGTGEGAAALFMLLGLPEDGVLYSVASPGKKPIYLDKVQADARLISVGDTFFDLSAFGTADLMGIDLLFTDLRPTYAECERALKLFRGFLSPEAVVAMDDIHLNPDMERFWEVLHGPKIDTGTTYHWSGFGLFHPGATD